MLPSWGSPALSWPDSLATCSKHRPCPSHRATSFKLASSRPFGGSSSSFSDRPFRSHHRRRSSNGVTLSLSEQRSGQLLTIDPRMPPGSRHSSLSPVLGTWFPQCLIARMSHTMSWFRPLSFHCLSPCLTSHDALSPHLPASGVSSSCPTLPQCRILFNPSAQVVSMTCPLVLPSPMHEPPTSQTCMTCTVSHSLAALRLTSALASL